MRGRTSKQRSPKQKKLFSKISASFEHSHRLVFPNRKQRQSFLPYPLLSTPLSPKKGNEEMRERKGKGTEVMRSDQLETTARHESTVGQPYLL